MNVLGGGAYLFRNLSLENIIKSNFVLEEDFIIEAKKHGLQIHNYGRSQLTTAFDTANYFNHDTTTKIERLMDCFQNEEQLKMILAILYQQLSFDWRPIYNQRQYHSRDDYIGIDKLNRILISDRVNPLIFSTLIGNPIKSKGKLRLFYTNNSSSMAHVFSNDYSFEIKNMPAPLIKKNISETYHNVTICDSDNINPLTLKNFEDTEIILDNPNTYINPSDIDIFIKNSNKLTLSTNNPSLFAAITSHHDLRCSVFISNHISADNLNNYNFVHFSK